VESLVLFISALFLNVFVFQLERAVFLREYCNQMYDLTPYYMTKMMIEIPILILSPLVMQVMVYWSIGFKAEPKSFWMQYFALEMLVQCASAIGFLISTIVPAFSVAITIAPAYLMPIILFGGRLVNLNTVFVWLRWIQWLSPIRYGFEALAISQWNDDPTTEFIYQV
jgi:ABC-type multidrug transport system permease subunit